MAARGSISWPPEKPAGIVQSKESHMSIALSIKQLTHTLQPVWRAKSTTEKLITKILVGLAAVAAGNSGMQMVTHLLNSPAQIAAVERSLLAGAATGLGALGLVFLRQLHPGHLTRFITLAAGAMLSAALFSLGLPAWNAATGHHGELLLAALAGAGLMRMLDYLVPHSHQAQTNRATTTSRRTLWLMIAAISLHNLPEGFAVGATAGTTDAQANSTALAIALQNIPEGLIVATGLWALGANSVVSAVAALLTGMIEPVGAILGAKIVTALPAATPLALAFAAGAMLFVVLHEMLPEVRKLNSPLKAGGLLAGSMLGMWVVNQIGG